MPSDSGLIIEASPGKGRWSDAPWIAIFDPLVTDTAQRGYYPVYLFTRTLDTVYLSINQGMTELRDELGTKGAQVLLRSRAKIMRTRITTEELQHFSVSNIDLQPPNAQHRLAFYEPGHSFGIKYNYSNLPSNDQLVGDLQRIVRLYRLITSRGGVNPLDTPDGGSSFGTLEEKRNYRYHRVVERNRKLALEAKRIHGYVCQVCHFNFEKKYGRLGIEYIEAHHLTPISELPEGERVELSPKNDFAVVCANCHRMLHRKGAPISFEEFAKMYKSIRKTS